LYGAFVWARRALNRLFRRFPARAVLTKRDAWAGTFDELLTLDAPRTDCPMHLPEPPKVAAPWTCAGCSSGPDELRRLAEADGPEGQHCSARTTVCAGGDALTMSQRRSIDAHRRALGVAAPDLETITYEGANALSFLCLHFLHFLCLITPLCSYLYGGLYGGCMGEHM
jgi:hypothetical protein